MALEIWLGYVAACTIVVLIPGPNIIFLVSYALRDGPRSGLATIPGILLGALIAMSASLAGAGALLAASAFWFTVLKILGALYLLWLAYSLWTTPVERVEVVAARTPKPMRVLFWQAVLVSLLNPKGPPFYAAFVPQFVVPTAPVLQQFALLIATFLVVALFNCLLWLLAARAMRKRMQSPDLLRIVSRTGAACLVAASVLTLRGTRMG